MKKVYILLGLLLVSLFPTFANAAGCDSTFYGTLRYGSQYTFYDDFNANSSDKWLWNRAWEYTEQYDYNNSTSFPQFNWTTQLKNADYKVAKNTTMTVIEADSKYKILSVPATRSRDNFVIKYTLTYSTDEAGKNKYTHTECKYYEISRCGDGVIDTSYDETCDPGDSTKKNRGNGGCSTSCKPVTVASPTCNSSYNGKRVTSLVDGSYLCSEGTVSNFTYSESTHKWTWKCGNAAGSVSCSATKPYCGDGIKDTGEACDPNDTSKSGWGNGGCSSTCTAITVDAPVCNSSYNGQRVSSLTSSNSLCSEGTVSNFTYSESTHKWTWKCNNTLGTSVSCSATKPYCGDGIKDSGEACDPNDTSKSGWGNGGCSSTCTAITVDAPVCNSSYNGQRVSSLTSSNSLCSKGTISNFTYSESTHKWTWKCNNTLGTSVSCSATKPYCGDGIKDSGEACDPNDTSKSGWGNGGCSSTCTAITVDAPVCNSSYNGQRVSSLTSSNSLCSKGTISNFTYSESTHKWTWKCNNTLGTSVSCSATKPYCGDGIKDSGEACDPNDTSKSGWGNGGCSSTCTAITVDAPVCNSSYNGQRVSSLTSSNSLCSKGTISNFTYNESTHKWTWKCNNTLGTSVSCSATKPYCGDGVRDAGEACDPNDTSKTGWGNKGCDNSCEPIIESEGCDASFYKTLRYGKQYTFYDEFNANSSDKWMRGWQMEYDEQYDYNQSPNFPKFGRTSQLINNNYKVSKGTTMKVLEADSAYPIKAVPAVRSFNNLFIKYTLIYSTDEAGQNKYGHSECVYYEISRCGDGTIDSEYGETCDPADESHTNWGNGGCDASCKPITVAGPVCNSDYNGQRVSSLVNGSYLCKEGTPTNFKYDESTHKWTWSCDNVAGSVDCRAIKPYCGDGILDSGETCDPADSSHTNWGNGGCSATCEPITVADGKLVIEKTLVGSKEVKNTGDIITWNIKVTAVDGDVTNFTITDKLPDVLEYDSYTVKHSGGVTVGKPTVNGNNVSWEVTGTLKKGEYVEIELKTKARWMPKVDYVNVACVRPESNPEAEDCDDVEIPVDGKLVIEKTLVGSKEVKNTGDIITWNIKVTAVDGDVTNFTITDKLPDVLEYDSYTVKHSGGVTVGKPTVNGNNVSWEVTGTLKKGEYVEIELKTKARWMPKVDYVNVACVRPESNPEAEDCDDVEIPVDGKLVIEKTLVGSKEVKNTGDIITWNIKVTAVDGDVTNFTITDKLPDVLEYDSYTVKHSGGVTVGKPTVNGNNVSWEVTGTLKKGEYVEIELKTKARWMPKVDYVNVACVRPESNPEAEDCDDVEIPVDGKLVIEKTLVGSKEVKNTGDVITWNIKVTAVDGDVTNFTITDKMPSILGYKDSFVLHNPGLTIGTPVISGNEVSWKVTGTLEKGEYVEIQLTTYAKVMPDQDYDNVACVKYVGEDGKEIEDCDDEPLPAPHIWIKKHFTDGTKEKTVKIGDLIGYRIDFGNTGNASATVTSIKDFLPKNVGYISSEIFVNGEKIHTNETQKGDMDLFKGFKVVDGVYIDIYGGITLTPNSTGYIILTGRVLGEYTGNRTNFACIYLNDKKVDCDDAHHNITDELMCKKLDITTRSFGSAGGSTNVSCSTDGGQAELIEIDCGNGTVITGSNISVLPGICSYPSNSSSSSKSYTVQCKVDGKTNNDCKSSVSVQGQGGGGSTDPYCTKPTVTGSDRVKTVVCETDNGRSGEIKIDCGYGNQVYTSNGKVKSFTGTCDYSNAGYGTYKIRCRVDNRDILESECTNEVKYTQPGGPSGGGGCSNCDKKVEAIYTAPKCFNVNAGNVSIQAGEILPFYRNIERIKSDDLMSKGWFDEKDYGYGDVNTYKNLQNTSCNTAGQIALSSMVCHFVIKDGKGNEKASGSYPCLNEKNASNPRIVDAWIAWQRTVYHDKMDSYSPNLGTDYTFRSNVYTISNFGNNAEYFGEYKISLNKVDYLYCDAETNEWTPGPAAVAECTSDFALTNPYTVQKTPSGNFRASTTVLGKYLYMNGSSTMSGLLSAISTTEYEATPSVDNAMEDFKNKYKKLAVTVTSSNGKVIKKVPGKNIYFVEGNIELGGDNPDIKFDKPVTFIQTQGNTKIYGSVTNLNMMLLTDGTITFSDINNCNPTQTQTRQTVKGIFYAKSGLIRDGVKMNKATGEYKRCSEGGLTIRGVLIGKGLQGMMDASRSSLNDWFNADTDTKKKNTVMNGASVLIEYSPSVFTKSTMPPGAEDFTTALSIYKQ